MSKEESREQRSWTQMGRYRRGTIDGGVSHLDLGNHRAMMFNSWKGWHMGAQEQVSVEEGQATFLTLA